MDENKKSSKFQLKSKIRLLMAKKGIKYIEQVSEGTGIERRAITNIADNLTSRIEKTHIIALRDFFEVKSISDLFEFEDLLDEEK